MFLLPKNSSGGELREKSLSKFESSLLESATFDFSRQNKLALQQPDCGGCHSIEFECLRMPSNVFERSRIDQISLHPASQAKVLKMPKFLPKFKSSLKCLVARVF